jgi:hypothetical protein
MLFVQAAALVTTLYALVWSMLRLVKPSNNTFLMVQ